MDVSPVKILIRQIFIAAVAYVIFNIIFTGIYYFLTVYKGKDKEEEQHWSTSNKKMKNFFDLFYYSSTVSSTVGFGDIYPVSKRLKTATMVHQFLIAIGFIGMLLNFEEVKKQYMLGTRIKKMDKVKGLFKR